MPDRTMVETMDAFGELLDEFDDIARRAHARYRAYKPEDLIELDSRAQAACTYAHMLADAHRRFLDRPRVRPHEIRGLKLWQFEDTNTVFRFKKMDENGSTWNYPTKQARDFDAQKELPGLPMPPVRLTAGYYLNAAGEFVRTQVSRPGVRKVRWCAAIVPTEERKLGERAWYDVAAQGSFP